MPWKRAKALPPPDNTLFEACFRIQAEAIEAAGHHIPLVVENVCGAQKWVGRARWHYGSFYLWGDVPALMPITTSGKGQNPDGRKHGGDCFSDPLWPGKQGGVKHHGSGPLWFDTGPARLSSKSTARKAASAHIAKIPFALSRWIAESWLRDG